MKVEEKRKARTMRQKGFSINEIYPLLKVAKSSVSLWVRDIELTTVQKRSLSLKGHSKEAIEKRRISRLTKENLRRQIIIDKAQKEIYKISSRELFLIGISLYWAEGAKTRRGILQFSNGDPKLIKIMMRFFKEICHVPDSKFRAHIHLHPHLPEKRARLYWQKISEIHLKQFFKTSQQHNKASQNKKDSLPYGTFSIYVCNTVLFLKIMGWMNGMYSSVVEKDCV